MSMHLEKPYLTTMGKKKGKAKWASSSAKHKAEILNKDWEEMLKKWEPKSAIRKQFKKESLSPAMSTPRVTKNNIPSIVTPGGDCTKKDPVMYTGDKVLGIAVLHKSCLQPVFSTEEAIDISKMRR